MALQVIPQYNSGDEWGKSLGAALQSLASGTIDVMQQRKNLQRTASGLSALGFSPQEAEQIAGFQPEIVKEIVSHRLKNISPNASSYEQFGFSPQEAAALVNMPEANQRAILKERLRGAGSKMALPQHYQTLIKDLTPEESEAIAAVPQALQRQYFAHKLSQAAAQEGGKGLRELIPSLSKEAATSIAKLPANLQNSLYSSYLESGLAGLGLEPEEGMEEAAPAAPVAGGLSQSLEALQQQAPQPAGQIPSFEQMAPFAAQQVGLGGLLGGLGAQQQQAVPQQAPAGLQAPQMRPSSVAAQPLGTPLDVARAINNPITKVAEATQSQARPAGIQAPGVQEPIAPLAGAAVQPEAPRRPLSTTERIAQARAKKEEVKATKVAEKEAKAEQQRTDKSTQAYYDDLFKGEEAATDSLARIGKMKNIITKKGGLPISAIYNLYNNVAKINPVHGAGVGGGIGVYAGGPIGGAIGAGIGGALSPIASLLSDAQKKTSPNAERFEQLATQYVTNMKTNWGASQSDLELQTKLQLVPTLAKTDQGKLALLRELESMDKKAIYKAKIARDVIKANNGKRPENFQDEVNRMAQPGLVEIDKKYAFEFPYFDFGVNEAKLPPASKSVIGATTSKEGQKYINVYGPNGPQWMPI